MGSTTRQVTLTESWGGGRGRVIPPIPTTSRGRGGARGRRGGSGTATTSKRGRRGRGESVSASSAVAAQQSSSASADVGGFEDDDDDDVLCVQALSNFELVTNEVSRAFEEINKSKELPGFDSIAGDIWIYPTNRPVRDYQFNIVQTALYHNTMVSLPTGLGKTFIAAVVMYNFHRWYPNNLIIFMAPTRPLVTQQLDACHELMGIHPSKMVELTGHIPPKRREELWKEKKVFFLTPQVMTSDLGRGSCSPDQIRCIVVDEAHKSLGNHAYAQVVKMMVEKNKCFRILALSATPGNDFLAVQEVLKNLLISRIELRNETSLDILPYTHQKQVETVVVPLDAHINSVHQQVMEIFQNYTGKLMKQNALFGRDGSSFTQFQLLKARESYRQNQKPGVPNYQKGYIEVDFATCISIAHSMELLLNHGLRSFYSFLHCVLCKEKGTPVVASELKKSTNIEQILQEVQDKLNISAENSFFDLSTSGLFTTFSKPSTSKDLPDPSNPEDYLLSHPKMRVLRDLVEKHFRSHPTGTRIMIFSEYRDSVQEIGNMLNALRPLVKPMVFLGQSKGAGVGGRGLRQKEQVQIIQSFRTGEFNVLVSTCVGEEGLDIGEVDLIICFDASKSPTRLVQRMGRTGRKREGKTIFLLTQGKEQRMYSSSVSQQQHISKGITDTSVFEQILYKESPRMVPAGLVPQCFKMDIILSSEQRGGQAGDEPEIVEIDDEVPTSRKPKAKITLPKKRATSKKSTTSGSSSGTTVTGDSNNGATRNVYTITRCFENMQQQQGTERTVSTKLSAIVELDDEDDEVQVMEMDDFSNFDTEVPTVGSDYQKYLKELIGIKDVEPGTVTKCVFVPKLPRTRMDFSDFDMSNFDEISKDFDIERLREGLNSVYILGPPSNRCDCGLLLVDDDMMDFEQVDNDDFLDQDFGAEIDVPVSLPGRTDSSPIPPESEPGMGLSPLYNYTPDENQSMNQVEETEALMSDSSFETAFLHTDFNEIPGINSESEPEERSPIFKRLRRSVTPGEGKRLLFDQSPLKAPWNQTTPKRNVAATSTASPPDSPDEYPPSPILKTRPLVKSRPVTFRTSASAVTMAKEPLRNQVTSPQNPNCSQQSSDGTCYESENSVDERDLQLSPILTRTIQIQTPVRSPTKIVSSTNVTEGQLPKKIQSTTNPERKGETEHQGTPKTVTGSQENLVNSPASASPHSYPPSQVIERKPPGPRKLFSFRKKEGTAVAAIPFHELPFHSPPPPPPAAAETITMDITIQSPTIPTMNSSIYSDGSQRISQNRGGVSQDPPFETTSQDLGLVPFDSDEDDVFFIPSYRSVVPASGSVNLSGDTGQSGPSGRRGGEKTGKQQNTRKRKRNGNNGFILEEAEVDGNGSSTTEGSEDSDSFDHSFVAVEESPPNVTYTQQVRYLKSTKETPKRKFGRKKSLDEIALERVENQGQEDLDLDDYQDEEASTQFCVANDFVEHVSAGDFTQRMDEARVAVQLESPSARFKRTLRSKTRRGRAAEKESPEEFKLPTTKPLRKRILVVSSDDSE